MSKNLVIVESPAKAKTLKKFLGSNYKIEASVGHVRDLPKSELGIDVENDFEPKYITIRGKGEVLSRLRKEVKKASKVYLATDPDREGEAISWHLQHALKLDSQKAQRITFNEITQSAVKRSIKEARDINFNLVDAQQARREVDRIVGYKISPFLWRKIKKGLSAGRVQSATLKMICDREEEIENFIPQEYWTIDAFFPIKTEKKTAKASGFTAKFYGDENGKIEPDSRAIVDEILKEIKDKQFTVAEVKHGTRSKKPYPPFTTSTLQQEASKVLGFATAKTMLVAQQLYEGVDIKGEGTVGLLSYVRTDSTRISDEAYQAACAYITQNLGKEYLPEERPVYKSKARAQDAHEAIRPTQTDRTPTSVKESLTKEQFKLYKLVWERFLASQMAPAVYDTVSVRLSCGKYSFRASGSRLTFDGYLKIYDKDEEEEQLSMPSFEQGAVLNPGEIKEEQHFTQPPARFSESMLVKTMEEVGIGRPSTYSATITNLVQRGYVTKENKVFYPTELGEVVNDIMKDNFEDIVDTEFTAKMEDDLDKVEDGLLNWKEILRKFYGPLQEKIELAEERVGAISVEHEKTDVLCENCGRNMVIKFSKFGKFLACPGFPECRNTKSFFEEVPGASCPLCGGAILIKKTKKGRKYYGCANHPDCEFLSWNKPTGEKCPVCSAHLIEKGTKKRMKACSDTNCAFTPVELPDEDEE